MGGVFVRQAPPFLCGNNGGVDVGNLLPCQCLYQVSRVFRESALGVHTGFAGVLTMPSAMRVDEAAYAGSYMSVSTLFDCLGPCLIYLGLVRHLAERRLYLVLLELVANELGECSGHCQCLW